MRGRVAVLDLLEGREPLARRGEGTRAPGLYRWLGYSPHGTARSSGAGLTGPVRRHVRVRARAARLTIDLPAGLCTGPSVGSLSPMEDVHDERDHRSVLIPGGHDTNTLVPHRCASRKSPPSSTRCVRPFATWPPSLRSGGPHVCEQRGSEPPALVGPATPEAFPMPEMASEGVYTTLLERLCRPRLRAQCRSRPARDRRSHHRARAGRRVTPTPSGRHRQAPTVPTPAPSRHDPPTPRSQRARSLARHAPDRRRTGQRDRS